MPRRPALALIATALVALIAVAGWLMAPSGASPRPESPPPRNEPAPLPRSSDISTSEQVAGALPRFVDVAAEAGLTEPHFEAADGRFRLVETMGSGVGLIDFDADGRLDIIVPQGSPLPYDPADRRRTARLYRNQGDGTFADVTDAAGVGFNGYGQGVAVGDYDGDGRDDLFLSGFGRSALYRNNGDGTFADVTDAAGVTGSGWATSCAFADLDDDGDLDLYVVHYLADTVDARGEPTVRCKATDRMGYCPPTAHRAEADELYRNNGDGTFTDVSDESGIGSVAGNGLGLVIADLDEDGKLDVFVADDQTPNLLWRNLGGLRFEEVALAAGVAYDEGGRSRAGMGIACGDLDGDGRLDLFVTNFYEEPNTLYRNADRGRFQVATAAARLSIPSRDKLGFGVGTLDFDADGRLDLFVANGHVNDVRSLRMPYQMEPQLFRNVGRGRFVEVTRAAGPYFAARWLGRGAAFGDLDDDGDTDVVVTHLGRPPALLRNDTTPRGHSVRLRLLGAGPSRTAVGARVKVRAGGRESTHFVVAGASYLSASDPRLLIGLGDADRVERLEIRWPSGRSETWHDLAADRAYEIAEGQEPRPRPFAPH